MFKLITTLFLLIIAYSGSTLKFPEKISYELLEERLVGVDLTYALFSVDLDEDIYLLDSFYCTPGCRPPTTECSACDLVSEDNCGYPPKNSSIYDGPSECPCPQKVIWCPEFGGGSYYENVISAEANQEYGPFESRDIYFFKFYYEQPCHGIYFIVEEIYGSVIYQALTNTDQENIVLIGNEPRLMICPNEYFGKYGTFFFGTGNEEGSPAMFKVKVLLKDFGNDTIALNEPQTCEDDPSSICISEGVTGTLQRPTGAPVFFRFSLTSCGQFLFGIEQISLTFSQGARLNYTFAVSFLGIDEKVVAPVGFQLNTPEKLSFNVCPINEQSYIYITVLNLASFLVDYSFNLVFLSDPSLFEMTKLSDIDVGLAKRYVQGAFDVICGDNFFPCRYSAESTGGSCFETWTAVPTQETTGLWPRPTYLKSIDPTVFKDLIFVSEEKLKSNRVSGVLMLKVVSGQSVTEPFQGWETQLDECVISFPYISRIGTIDGQFLKGNFPVVRNETIDCDSQKFHSISQEIDDLLLQMSQETDTATIFGVKYNLDSKTFTPTWHSCINYIDTFLESEYLPTEYFDTTDCPTSLANSEQGMNDPCCQDDLRWEQCCIERSFTIEQEKRKIKEDLQNTDDICGDTECLESYLEDYLFYMDLRTSLTGCSSAISESLEEQNFVSLKPVVQCKNEIFGSFFTGVPCKVDSDCLSGICDIDGKYCHITSQEQFESYFNNFFTCLDEKMPSLVKEFLMNLYDVNKVSNWVDFFQSIYRMDDCYTGTGVSSDYGVGYKHYTYLEGAVVDCDDYLCTDDSCLVPLRCELNRQYGRPDSPYPYSKQQVVTNEARCNAVYQCNWNTSVIGLVGRDFPDSICDTGTKTCMICETQYICHIIDLEEQDCFGEVCVLNNGTVLPNISKEECESIKTCSFACEDCNDSEEICSQHGFCGDDEIFKYLKEKANRLMKWTMEFNDSYCVHEMAEWNAPDCTTIPNITNPSLAIPTSIGCLLVVDNEEECNDNGGNWIKKAYTKEQCERVFTCEEPLIPTTMTTPKDKTQCDLCGGTYRSSFEWTPGFISGGRMRTAEWIEKGFVLKNQYISAINFAKITQDIISSNFEPYSIQMLTESECNLNPLKAIIEDILCLCESENSSYCFNQQQDSNVKIGIGKACPNTNYTLIAPPAILTFNDESIVNSCTELRLGTLLASEMTKPPTPSISITFRKKSKSFDNVKNDKGVKVGKLIGNGISINLDSIYRENIQSFTLCLVYDESSSALDELDVLDFGMRLSKEDVRPLSIKVSEGAGSSQLCGLVYAQHLEKLDFFPIVREKNYEDKSEDSLSEGEKGVYGFMLAIYLVLMIILLAVEISDGRSFMNPKKWITMSLFCCMFVRVVYFGTLLANTLSEDSDSLSEFLLVEIPTYFFFLAILISAIIWSQVHNVHSASELPIRVLKRLAVPLILLIVFLIIIIVTWEQSSEDDSYTCEGRLYSSGSSSTQEDIRTAYRVILSVIAIIIILSISFFTFRVYSAVKKSQNEIGQGTSLATKIYQTTSVATISMVAQNIFFIAYSETVDSSYEWLLMLLLIEWLPIVMIVVVLRTPSSSPSSGKNTGTPATNTGTKNTGKSDGSGTASGSASKGV